MKKRTTDPIIGLYRGKPVTAAQMTDALRSERLEELEARERQRQMRSARITIESRGSFWFGYRKVTAVELFAGKLSLVKFDLKSNPTFFPGPYSLADVIVKHWTGSLT